MQEAEESNPSPMNVGLLLFIPYRELEERVFRAVMDAGYDDISLPQARLFQRIAADGSRIGELAAQVYVTKQTASALVGALEKGGYVERAVDPADARATLIRVAPRGRAAAAVAAAEIELIERQWRSELGAARYGRLLRDLQVLRRLTDRSAQ